MIYLIGGSPRCGKTTVAKKLAMKSHIPWFPADYLASAVSQYISEGERADKFPLAIFVNKTTPTIFYIQIILPMK